MRLPLVPADFAVPSGLETPTFRIRMLTVNDVVKDYEAVMVNRDRIQGVFGPHSQWPTADLSLEQDLIDLGWHQKEFQNRTSFAYTVMSLDESRCLGCVYIYPAEPTGYDAQVILWAIGAEPLTAELHQTVKRWMAQIWPFQQVGFPGREIPWSEWRAAAVKPLR